MADVDLLDAVRRHKSCFFRSGWANYETARPGSLRLLPPEHRVTAIRQDYRRMQEMLFGKPPSLDEIFDIIADLEKTINEP